MSYRKSPLGNAIESNERLTDLVARRVPGYGIQNLIGQAALQMLADAEHAQQAAPPMTPDAVAAWLDAEVDRRLAQAGREARAAVLREVAVTTAAEAETLLHQHTDDLIAGLAAQFDEVMRTAAEHVAAMDGVATASDAIQAGCAEHWKSVADLLPTYTSIRAAQRRLYGAMPEQFDRIACGDTQLIADPEARLYFHARLDGIASGWRGGEPLPWPDDPTERLVWCVKQNSGAWVPTPTDINELLMTATLSGTPSMFAESITTNRPSVPRAYDPSGHRRHVDQSNHGFNESRRGFGKPLSQLTVASVQPSLRDDDA